jgi:alkyl hydroperoxide reductase subunit F
MSVENLKEEYDLIILGGGPAGLTAAAYAIHKRIETMLISEDLGGKTNYQFYLPDMDTHLIIDGQELVSKFKNQIEYLDFARHIGKVIKFERKKSKFIATTTDRTFKGRAAIIATGVMPKRLNVPGEMEFLGHGVSYSTVSHAPVFVDVDVAVVGDGLRALQAAAELTQIAKKVFVIGVPSKLANSTLGKKVKKSGKSEFLGEYHLKAILGEESPDRIVLSKKNGGETEIPVKGIFIEMGYTPNAQMFSKIVRTTRDGRIMINENNQTNIPGLFAAGDVTDAQAQQVVIAMGEGANAALNAYDYLLGLKRQ